MADMCFHHQCGDKRRKKNLSHRTCLFARGGHFDTKYVFIGSGLRLVSRGESILGTHPEPACNQANVRYRGSIYVYIYSCIYAYMHPCVYSMYLCIYAYTHAWVLLFCLCSLSCISGPHVVWITLQARSRRSWEG